MYLYLYSNVFPNSPEECICLFDGEIKEFRCSWLQEFFVRKTFFLTQFSPGKDADYLLGKSVTLMATSRQERSP